MNKPTLLPHGFKYIATDTHEQNDNQLFLKIDAVIYFEIKSGKTENKDLNFWVRFVLAGHDYVYSADFDTKKEAVEYAHWIMTPYTRHGD